MKKKIIISSVVAVVLVVVLAIINQRNKAEAARKSNDAYIDALNKKWQEEDAYFESLKNK
jgi:hypothetical protein